MRRWILLGVAALLVLVGGAGVAYYLHVKHESRDIKGSSTIEFVSTQPPPPKPQEPGIAWPIYGHDLEAAAVRDRHLARPAVPHGLDVPRAEPRRVPARGRLRPAVLREQRRRDMFAIGARNGRKAWNYASDRCVAASPAVDRHLVFETFLNTPPCNRPPSPTLTGELIAFHVGRRPDRVAPSPRPSESSPLVAGGKVYVGDWSGKRLRLRGADRQAAAGRRSSAAR